MATGTAARLRANVKQEKNKRKLFTWDTTALDKTEMFKQHHFPQLLYSKS